MKKLFLLSIIAVFALSNVNAQLLFNFGVKAGANFADIGGKDSDMFNGSVTSFHIGGVVNIGLSEKLSVQPEVIYSSQGASFDGGDLTIDYINIPVLAKFNVVEGLSIEAGPQIGFLLSAKADGEGDVKDFFKSTDFSGAVGVGYKMENGLNFSARYNLGLGNIVDDSSDGEWKNNVFQLSVGYMFL